MKNQKTVRTPENIAAMAESVPRSQQLNISETSLRRIDMTQYKVQLVQELKSIDHPMRCRFTKWACDRLTEDANFYKQKNYLFR